MGCRSPPPGYLTDQKALLSSLELILHIFQDDHTTDTTYYNEGTEYITTKYASYVFIVFIYQYAAPLLYLTFAYSRMSYTLSKVA